LRIFLIVVFLYCDAFQSKPTQQDLERAAQRAHRLDAGLWAQPQQEDWLACHRLRLNLPTTKQLTPSGETISWPLARHGRSISMALRQLLLLTWDEARPGKSLSEGFETIGLFSSFRPAASGGYRRAKSAERNDAFRHLSEQYSRARPTILPRSRRGNISAPHCWQVLP
jgi:hypothetical protein